MEVSWSNIFTTETKKLDGDFRLQKAENWCIQETSIKSIWLEWQKTLKPYQSISIHKYNFGKLSKTPNLNFCECFNELCSTTNNRLTPAFGYNWLYFDYIIISAAEQLSLKVSDIYVTTYLICDERPGVTRMVSSLDVSDCFSDAAKTSAPTQYSSFVARVTNDSIPISNQL